ncbi:hypothetical protein ABK040_011621 [Willaertia magna]
MDWFTLSDVFRNENLFLIYFNFKDILKLSHVNKVFYQIFSNNTIWFNLLQEIYPQLFIDENINEKLKKSNYKSNLLKLNYYSQKIIKNNIETLYSKINNKSNTLFTLLLSNYCYFGEGYITQLISQYYYPQYDPTWPDVARKHITYLNQQYIFDIFYESSQEEYSTLIESQIKTTDCFMFIIDTRVQSSNNYFKTIDKYIQQVERAEKLKVISIVIGFEDEECRNEMIKVLEYYKLQCLKKNNYCKFIFSVCNLKLHNDTLEIANNIVKNCIENRCEINYLKLMNDILSKKKIDKILLQNVTTNNGNENKCYLM